MRRADAARGEDVIVANAQRVERGDDFFLDVRHDPRLAQFDADARDIFRDIADVAVLGAAAENLIADHEHGGGYGLGRVGHSVGGSCFGVDRKLARELAGSPAAAPVARLCGGAT